MSQIQQEAVRGLHLGMERELRVVSATLIILQCGSTANGVSVLAQPLNLLFRYKFRQRGGKTKNCALFA